MHSLPDIPTALSNVEADALRSLSTGKNVLEVGALLGFSTVVMAQVANTVVSVDPHDGYPADNPRPTWEPFLQNLARYDVLETVTPYRTLLSDPGTRGSLDDHEPFEFTFIDADGTYQTTFAILDQAIRYADIDGLIGVHDYDLPEWPGAGEAVRDWCTQTGSRFGVIDTIALIRPRHPDD